MPEVSAVLFDWAGTIIDFGSCAPVVAMMAAFSESGLEVGEEMIRRNMGMSKRDHVEAILCDPTMTQIWRNTYGENWSLSDVEEIVQRFSRALLGLPAEAHTPIAGACRVIAALRAEGVGIGSTTGYSRTLLEAILCKLDTPAEMPQIAVCSNDVNRGRPAPDMLALAMGFLGAPAPDRCVTVDDAVPGLVAGRRAGTWTVACAASGNSIGLSEVAFYSLPASERKQRLAPVLDAFARIEVDFVIDTVADLPEVIDEISRRLEDGKPPGANLTRIITPGAMLYGEHHLSKRPASSGTSASTHTKF